GQIKMTGCIFKRKLPSGKISWGYCIDAGRDENGKRKQIFKSGFARKLDADIELARLVNDRNEGSLVRPDPRTFAEFSEAWLAEYAEASCAPKNRREIPRDDGACLARDWHSATLEGHDSATPARLQQSTQSAK